MAILKKLSDDDGLLVEEGIEEEDDMGPTRQRVDRSLLDHTKIRRAPVGLRESKIDQMQSKTSKMA
jgi:hypothetical protein